MDNRGFSKRTYVRFGLSVISFPHVAHMAVWLDYNNRPLVKMVLDNGKKVECYSNAPTEKPEGMAVTYKKQKEECVRLLGAWEEYLEL